MRTDISPYLIHFTSDSTTEAAYQRFRKIIKDGYLLGSSDKIKGGCRCVCFSEAPIQNLMSGLVNEKYYSRYSLFGFMFNKLYIFSLGGRPVIYQPETEYYALPENLRWRHMRYEPTSEDPIDFTWEREWRVPIEKLEIHPSYTHLEKTGGGACKRANLVKETGIVKKRRKREQVQVKEGAVPPRERFKLATESHG